MLRGTDELFGTVAVDVGIAFEENRRLRTNQNPPMTLLLGGRGMGKTAVLSAISRAYGNRVPRVLLDLADERYGADADGLDPADAPLLSLLRDLEWELELQVGRHRGHPRLRFPRLSFALLAIATWQPNPELSLDEAKRVLATAGRELSDTRAEVADNDRKDRQEFVADVINDISNEILTHAAPFPVNVLLKAGVKSITKRMLRNADSRDALGWHSDVDFEEPGDGYEALLRLARDYHRTKEFRERAERSLVAAFLADISAGFGGWAKFARAGRPIILLDNVLGHEVGIQFLNLVLSYRVSTGTDPLVIVAAGPGSLGAQIDLGGLPGGRRQPPAGWPDAYLRWQDLSVLTYDDTLAMLAAADPRRTPPDLGHLLYRLTGGLPLAVSAISDAVIGKVPAGVAGAQLPPVAVTGILALPAVGVAGLASGEPVGTYLLRSLIPDSDLRDELTIFAAATDLDAARSLAGGGQDDRAGLAQQFLLAHGWGASPHHFVGDPLLRALLLDNLSHRAPPMTAGQVHTALLDRPRASEEGGETGAPGGSEGARLYHRMALGRVSEVAAWLVQAFAARYPANAWLAALRQAACAPAPESTDGDQKRPDRRALALGAADAALPDEIHRSVFRLLHAAWLLTDPLIPPERRVIDGLASELMFLGKKHPAGHRVLSEASEDWPKSLRAWQQQACDRLFNGE